jgi:hypothetical protein
MRREFDNPQGLVPQSLDAQDSRAYEERTGDELRRHMMACTAGLLVIDAIELVGSRPDTLIVFRYHRRSEHVGRDAGLVGKRSLRQRVSGSSPSILMTVTRRG